MLQFVSRNNFLFCLCLPNSLDKSHYAFLFCFFLFFASLNLRVLNIVWQTNNLIDSKTNPTHWRPYIFISSDFEIFSSARPHLKLSFYYFFKIIFSFSIDNFNFNFVTPVTHCNNSNHSKRYIFATFFFFDKNCNYFFWLFRLYVQDLFLFLLYQIMFLFVNVFPVFFQISTFIENALIWVTCHTLAYTHTHILPKPDSRTFTSSTKKN